MGARYRARFARRFGDHRDPVSLVGDGETPVPAFTPEQIRQDGQNRIARTAGQTGVAGAFVFLASAFFRWRGWLHGELDSTATGAWVIVLSAFAAAGTNIGRLRGRP